jgi:glycosyltransferase involved in cell wall biosynthesis
MRRIGMVMFNYYLGLSPLLINSASILANAGYEVHIFIDAHYLERSEIDFPDNAIHIHPIKVENHVEAVSRGNRMLERIKYAFGKNGRFKKLGFYDSPISKLYWRSVAFRYLLLHKNGHFKERLYRQTKTFFPDLFEFYKKVLPFFDNRYSCIIGVDYFGLVASCMIIESATLDKKPKLIYYNMELLLETYPTTIANKVLKSLERDCNKRCDITIIQDTKRARYLIDDNGVPEEKIMLIPVSGMRAVCTKKSNYLQTTLGIDSDKKVILYAGSILEWAMCFEIAEAAQNWSEDFVLVMHSARKDIDIDYVNRIREIALNKEIYLSLNPIQWELVPDLISSADIGLIFYKNVDPNYYEIGSSSNKLVQYLQVGLPVIAINFPSLKEVIDLYRCGECAQDPTEIELLARKILANYDVYRANALKCYEEKYKISKYIEPLLNTINSWDIEN